MDTPEIPPPLPEFPETPPATAPSSTPSSPSSQTTGTTQVQCKYCDRDLSDLNPHNREVHITACKKKKDEEGRKKTEKRKTKSLLSYFSKTSKAPRVDDDVVSEVCEVSEDLALSTDDVGVVTVDDVVEMDIKVAETQASLEFCAGYIPPGFNILQNFPFQILDSCTFVVSKQKFHAVECGNRNFVMDINIDGDLNWECQMLKYDASFKNIMNRTEVDDPTSTINDSYLSFNQLKHKLDTCRGKLSLLSIEKHKLGKKAERLGKTLSFHKRLVVMIAENKIPRLHFLVNVALRNQRSIQYIVAKCTEAVAGVYRARVDQDDRDLTFLVLKFGGPSLLDILYRAGLLPSTSLAYRISKAGVHLHTSVKLSFKEVFHHNFKLKFAENDTSKYGLGIKSDETFISPRLRHNSKNNEIVGVCYEHHKNINLQFNCLEDAHDLQKKLSEELIHIPKECLVTGLSSVVENIPFQVILMWPTCSKNDFDGMARMYVDISDALKDKIDANPLNFNTDGDSTRRQAMNAITQYDLDMDSELGKIISALPLIDRKVGKNQETVNFDAKHLVKRCWTSLISGKLEIGGVLLTKKDVEGVLEASEKKTHSVESLIYPRDKQSVPHATDCLLSFMEVINDSEKQQKIPFKLTMVLNDLLLVVVVYEALVCMYSYVTYSLTEQIQLISKAATCLLALFREETFTIPNQLFHDIQRTFTDTIYCVAKLQIHAPDRSFYTILNGTDHEERFFGNSRMSCGHKSLDAFELANSASSISMCEDILQRHPAWVKKGRMSRRLVLDHSNCRDWTGDLKVCNVDLVTSWKVGMLEAQTLAVKAKYDLEPTELQGLGYTLERPRGRVVGVTEKTVDWSIPDEESVEEVEDDTESDDIQLSEVIDNAEVFIEIDGKNVYKSTILKQINKEAPLSSDRLRRVRGLSKFISSEKDQTNLNDAISLGDPLIVEHQKKMVVAVVMKIMDGDHPKEFVSASDLQNLSTRVVVRELKLKEVECNLYSTGEYASEELTVSGKNCMTIKPYISLNPPEGCSVYYFDKQLIQDIGVHLTLINVNQQQSSSRSTTSATVSAPTSSTASASGSASGVTCKVCKKKNIQLKDMRSHVGKHIVKRETGPASEHVCGFCGKEGCKHTLQKSSHSRDRVFNAPKSDCVYHYSYKKLGQKATRYTPCLNRITNCPVCNMYIWSYNLVPHYHNAHPEEDTDAVKIPEEEKNLLKKSKF